MKKPVLLFCSLLSISLLSAQTDFQRNISIGVFGGIVSYQGDLQPHSFSFGKSKTLASAWVRYPINRRISLKAGLGMGKLSASDAFNREYLRERNLSFSTMVREASVVAEIALLDLERTPFSPYVYAGALVFQFNPYTYDAQGEKTYLQPLGTEGQGLAAYPDRKKYKRTQPALSFGAGLRVAVNSFIDIGVEAGQRKTFTDYIDDVSKTYVDQDLLRAGNGEKAVELAFRGDEWHNAPYPEDGAQRGTPREMDWYYTVGLTMEVKLQRFRAVLYESRKDVYNRRCPKVF